MRKCMNRAQISFIIDWVLILTLLLTLWSGLSIVSFKWLLFNFGYSQVFSVHKNASIMFAIFTGFHHLIHRKAIIDKTKKVLGHHDEKV
jgi:hypothetical protein